jgi:glycosyltransferase involved in cell wall biosynthesis
MTLPSSSTDLNASRAPSAVQLSVVIPTLNEAIEIADAVRSLDWAEEVIVVDGGSSDATAELAASAGARVVTLKGQTIGAQRNAGILAARTEWVLTLDADERVSPELREEIRRELRAPKHEGYRLRFRSFFLGRQLRHGVYGRDWHVRLFPRERRYNLSRVHESLEPIADVAPLGGTVDHRPFRDFSHYVTKVMRYARWGADDLAARDKRATAFDLAGRPAWRFVRDYILYGGFRDGLPGFLVAAFAGVGTLLKYSYRITEQRRK